MKENNTYTRVKILEDGTPVRLENKFKKSSYIKKNKIKKYISKIDGKYFYPKDYYKKYYTYTPVKKGPYFSSGKPKKMYKENGEYIYIEPPKSCTMIRHPEPINQSPSINPPAPITKDYYWRNMEIVKQKQKDRRVAFNKTLPSLNLICTYCNKPFILPGMNEKGHKQHEVMYCSGVCGDRAGRFRKLWIPKWLFNYYLDKKLFRMKVGFKLRTRWTLKLLLKSDKNQNLKLKKFLRKYWWWNEDNRKSDEYNVIKKYYTYCMAFILLRRFKFCNECFKPFMFISTTRTYGRLKVYNYKSMIAQRIRKYKNMELYGKNFVPKEEHVKRGRKIHCSSKCADKRTDERIRIKRARPLFSRLIGKGPYIIYKRYGLKKIIFTKRRFTKLKGIKMRIHIRIRLLHYNITSPFVNFYHLLFFKCRWCRIRLNGSVTQRFCNERCEDRYKRYSQRLLPLWFYRRFYTKYNLYKIRWQYYPRVKNHIKELVVHIIRFLKKKLKKSKTPYYIRKGPRLSTCKHCQQKFDGKGFCSSYCRTLFKEAIVQRRKERNLVAWGTEERPDEETRKKIQRKKNAEWQRYKVKTDPGFKLIKMMRTRTKKVMKKYRVKGSSEFYAPLDLLKVLEIKDGDELRVHIEDQFTEGMSWSNHGQGPGKWVVDHHIPIKYWNDNFDLLNDLEIQKKCFGKYNLKPLWWVDNAHKAAKLDYNESK